LLKELGDDHDNRQKDYYVTAKNGGVDDDSLSYVFPGDGGPAGTGRGSDTTPVGHRIY
jgi:hypothetical protein